MQLLFFLACLVNVAHPQCTGTSSTLDILGSPYLLTGNICPVHDPSLALEGTTHHVFSTDIGTTASGFIPHRCSANGGLHWELCGYVFETLPPWVSKSVGSGVKGLWAPDISFNSATQLWTLYYAASTFGSQISGIGLATAQSLNNPSWVDKGEVLSSKMGDPYNAIDPSMSFYGDLAFGSFWKGLYSVNPKGVVTHLAERPTEPPDAIEASSLIHVNSSQGVVTTWLFASYDFCCRGANSTYNVRVGRGTHPSTTPLPTFVDQQGIPMSSGGGTLLLEGGSGGWAACGGQSPLRTMESTLPTASSGSSSPPPLPMVLHAYSDATGEPYMQLVGLDFSGAWVKAVPFKPAAATLPPVLQRAQALLSQLTQDEKLHQLLRATTWDGPTSPYIESGVGMYEMGSIFAGATLPSQAAQARNAVVSAMLSAGPGKRLGIPPSFRTLATHGGEAFGTVFPQGPGLGATFDVDLARAIAGATAAECRALGVDLVTFVIHMVSDARFGRQEEGFSEEPVLTGLMGQACVEGAQGRGGIPSDAYILPPNAPTLFKHLGAYGSPVGGLNGWRADVSEYTLRDSLMRPWRKVALAGSRGVMPSHNSVLNCPAHGNQDLLLGMIRGEFGQNLSLILSDTGDVSALRGFHLCSSDATCAALALTAGVDMEQPPGTTYLALPLALQQGLVTQGDIDSAVLRVLVHKLSSGLLDTPFVNASAADDIVNAPSHRQLAREAAEGGAVLLKNDNHTLPLKPGIKVAVIGPLGGCGNSWHSSSSSSSSGGGGGSHDNVGVSLCEAQESMLGNYAPNQPPLTGVATVSQAMLLLPPSQGPSSVVYARGCNVNDKNTSLLLPPALEVARDPEVGAIVLVLGDSLLSCGESKDRSSLDLPGGQLALLEALVTANPPLQAPIVVVLINGRSVTFGGEGSNALLSGVSALLVGWRPGQEGGVALSNLLFGVANPSGKLPFNWVKTSAHAGSSATPWLSERTPFGASGGEYPGGAEGRSYGVYWSEDGQAKDVASPLFAFGEGGSYTDFDIVSSAVAVNPPPLSTTTPIQATALVSNVGGVAGRVGVLAFVQDPQGVASGRVVRPWKRLVGFAKSVIIAPGGNATLLINVAWEDLAFHSKALVLGLQPGNYTLSLGLSSLDDAPHSHPFTL